MKKMTLLCALSLVVLFLQAQTPKIINYQASARNSNGQVLASQTIKVRLSVISSATGNPVLYSETRSVVTSALALFNVQIGSSGAVITAGNFNTIDWSNNSNAAKSLKVELDVNNNGNFVDMGTQSLVSVPYAFTADDALGIGGNPVSMNMPAVNSMLRWDGINWSPYPGIKSLNVAGQIANVAASGAGGPAWVFVGPTASTTLLANQSITGSISLVLGTSGATANLISVCPCYQIGAGAVTSFNPNNYLESPVTATRTTFSSSGSVTVTTAGTYKIGACVRNNTSVILNNNDWLNAFFLVH